MTTLDCIGCGHCCSISPCELVTLDDGPQRGPWSPCPDLVYRDGRSWCNRILERSGACRAACAGTLRIGRGCHLPGNSTRLTFQARRLRDYLCLNGHHLEGRRVFSTVENLTRASVFTVLAHDEGLSEDQFIAIAGEVIELVREEYGDRPALAVAFSVMKGLIS